MNIANEFWYYVVKGSSWLWFKTFWEWLYKLNEFAFEMYVQTLGPRKN